MHIITVPLKIWRPKPVDRFIPLPPYSDIDDDLCLSSAYSLAIRRTKEKSPPPSTRDDFILWDKNIHFSHLQNHLHLRDDMDITVRDAILSVVKKNWDAFDKQGVSRSILGNEFGVDTGASPPVCCQLPRYGIHESKIMTEQIEPLDKNQWIRDYKGAWRSMILIAPKTHQEDVDNINDFVWRLCVSYQGSESCYKSFMFLIPRCADSIENFGDSNGIMFFITLDARQGYHQISVRCGIIHTEWVKENVRCYSIRSQRCTFLLYSDDEGVPARMAYRLRFPSKD